MELPSQLLAVDHAALSGPQYNHGQLLTRCLLNHSRYVPLASQVERDIEVGYRFLSYSSHGHSYAYSTLERLTLTPIFLCSNIGTITVCGEEEMDSITSDKTDEKSRTASIERARDAKKMDHYNTTSTTTKYPTSDQHSPLHPSPPTLPIPHDRLPRPPPPLLDPLRRAHAPRQTRRDLLPLPPLRLQHPPRRTTRLPHHTALHSPRHDHALRYRSLHHARRGLHRQ